MKIILSRKGFDSTAGGIANLVLPDGRLIVFPIPDQNGRVSYNELPSGVDGYDTMYDLLQGLGCTSVITGTDRAHLDPDLIPDSIPRDPKWRGVFGQSESSLSHLINNAVGEGALFLFFAWFKNVEWIGDKLRYSGIADDRHIIYGYLHVERVFETSAPIPDDYNWIKYHPHFALPDRKRNSVFVAANKLQVGGKDYPGFHFFEKEIAMRRLTDKPGQRSIWRLPGLLDPKNGRTALTYHSDPSVWTTDGNEVLLKSVGRGQEFVFDTAMDPEAVEWLQSIMQDS
jgi:hypothetical protein